MMIQSNDTEVVENEDRLEVWTVKESRPHSLMVSCDKSEREKLDKWLEEVKGKA